MRTGLRIIAALLGGLGVLSGAAPFAAAQTSSNNPAPRPRIDLRPAQGLAGSSFTIHWSGYSENGYYCKGGINFTWDAKTPLGRTADFYPPDSGDFPAKVPGNAGPGTHTVYADCGDWLNSEAVFTVTLPPTTTTTTTTTNPPVPPVPPGPPPGQPPVITPPVRNPPVRNPPSTSTRRRPPVTTTTPPGTSVPPPVETTELPPLSTADPRPVADGDLLLDKPAIAPGEVLSASGTGCTPGAPVTLMSKGERVGGTVADSTGSFTAPVQFLRVEAGRHWVTTDCGVKLTAAVDQIVTSSTGGQSTTMIILVFFVLAGITVVRFR